MPKVVVFRYILDEEKQLLLRVLNEVGNSTTNPSVQARLLKKGKEYAKSQKKGSFKR